MLELNILQFSSKYLVTIDHVFSLCGEVVVGCCTPLWGGEVVGSNHGSCYFFYFFVIFMSLHAING